MLGQAHTPRRRLLPFAAIALAVLVAPAISGANSSQSVSALRAQDAAIAAKSRSAVLGLYSLDQQLSSANARLASLRRQQAGLRAQRATLELQLRIAKRSAKVAQTALATRIRALYEEGTVSPLEIVLGSQSLSDAMTNIDNLNHVTNQGEEVLAQLRSARVKLAAATRSLASHEAALAAATRSAAATAASLANARAQRSSYIASLAAQRRLTQSQIATVVARARAAQVRTAQIAAQTAPVVSAATLAPAPAAAADLPQQTAPSGRTLTVSATGYALGGTTATGLPVGWGVVAVDPSVIPLGTHMFVPGYGEAVAADTGGAIVGNTIDLWFPTVAQADAWGRRTVTIVLH